MINTHSTKIDIKAITLFWAFGECAVGGMLHALKLPFTGVFAGGISIISIALIAMYTENVRKIGEALFTVLAIKLLLSPHSPWQAYVAVMFQGYMGMIVFYNKKYFTFKCFVFALICMLESAFQKIIISLLIFGQEFFKAIDATAVAIFKSLHISFDASIVGIVVATYAIIHVIAALMIGYWIPKIPAQLDSVDISIPDIQPLEAQKRMIGMLQKFVPIFLFFIGCLLVIYLFYPDIAVWQLLSIFLRAILISTFLIFLVGPFIQFLIKKWIVKKSASLQENINDLKVKILYMINAMPYIIEWSKQYKNRIQKLKMLTLATLKVAIMKQNG